ncbi:MAG: STAS domain-containing protein [Candidatus Korobacteraceae bacterium]
MTTAIAPVCFAIDSERVAEALQAIAAQLGSADGEVTLDFSSVTRIDSSALRALDVVARTADEKSIKIMLRGVNLDIYRVLKLATLARRFSLVN